MSIHLRPPTLIAASIAAALAQSLSMAPLAFAQSQETSLPEVIVKGNRGADSAPVRSKASGFIDISLLETPLSLSVLTQAQMQDLRIRQSSDAMKFDASVSDAYNAVGYAEQFSIRGFALDNSSSYRKDGFAIPGDASIPLENKERIEILKGIAGFQAGLATPGGIVNYVTKRPTSSALRSLTLEASERGTAYGAIDLGDSSADKQFGYRINAAGERLRSYIKGADGERQFVSGAFDWHVTAKALLQLDLDYQHKSQLSAPGFQLSNGTDLPQGIRADMMLNNQPWAKPVDTENSNLGLRFEYQLGSDWQLALAGNRHAFKRDDYTAFPYGCGAANLYPGYCSNGDYDVYDYQSVNEAKSLSGMQALLNGKFATGTVKHQFAAGISNSRRRDHFGDYVYDFAGSSNIFHPLVVPPSANQTGPILLRRTDTENALFVQDIATLTQDLTLHSGLRGLQIERSEFGGAGYRNHYLLPTLALQFALQNNWSTYGAFTQGLEHGGVAPFGTDNQGAMLAPAKSKQVELGLKAELGKDLSLSMAAFRIKKPFEYTNTSNLYLRNGDALHNGLEFSLQGKLTPQLSVLASLSALQARQQNTGDASLDDKRVTNVPSFKSAIALDYALQQVRGLRLNALWQYAGSKAFSPDNKVTVPGYQVFNFGARYATEMAGTATTLRFNVDNAFDKFYWRDVSQSLGGYLFPGAPRTYKISAQFDF